MDADPINQKVLKLWRDKYKEDKEVCVPLIYPYIIKESGLLIIGLNPSFKPSGYKKCLKDDPQLVDFTYDKEFSKFFIWDSFIKWQDNFKKLKDIEKAAKDCARKKKSVYFGKFFEIAEYLGTDWEHIDILFIRETNQNNLSDSNLKSYSIRKVNKGTESEFELTEFGQRQFELSIQLIELIKPKIILVANKAASDIFKKQFNIIPVEKEGYRKIQLKGETVPIFLGPMITSQRMIDQYSLERLK